MTPHLHASKANVDAGTERSSDEGSTQLSPLTHDQTHD